MSRLHELKVTGELPPLNYQGKHRRKKFSLWGGIGFVGFIKNKIYEGLQAQRIRYQEHQQKREKRGTPQEPPKVYGGWRMKKLD